MSRLNDQIIVLQESPVCWRAWMEHKPECVSTGASAEIAVGSLVMKVTGTWGEFVVTRVEEIEFCDCGAPMVFEGSVTLPDGRVAHEYDVCDSCWKHSCPDCSKHIGEVPHCAGCYAEIA